MESVLAQLPIEPWLRHLVGCGIIILLSILSALVARFGLFVLFKRLSKQTSTDLDDLLVNASGRYIHLLVYTLGASVLSNYLESLYGEALGEKLFVVVDSVIYALGVIVVALLVHELLCTSLRWYAATVAARTESRLDNEFVPLIERIGKIVIFLLALLQVLDRFEVDVKGLIAVLGVGSLAIALAAQETIANMIGGFVIMTDRPFRIGDRVKLPDGTVCIVQQIGVRSTKFLTFDHSLIITPNAELMKSTIHNLNYPTSKARVVVTATFAHDIDVAFAKEVMLAAAANDSTVLTDPAPEVALLDVGETGLRMALYCHVADIVEQWDTANRVREDLLHRLRAAKIALAVPRLDISVKNGSRE